jgi:hypothetical protein
MKRLLFLILIGVAGAATAFFVTQVVSPAPASDLDDIEPQGLVDEFADLSRPTPEASPSPSPAAPVVSRRSPGGGAAAAPAPKAQPAQDGPRTPRGAARVEETPFPLDQPGAGDICGDMEDLDDRERCREDEKEAEEERERQEDAADDAEDNNN